MLDGQLGEAISTTHQFYPDLLENNLELLFVLRCRQFIEIVNGTEGESVPDDCSLPCVQQPLHVESSSATVITDSHRSCGTVHRLTTSSPSLVTTDTDRLTNGAALNLSASSTDKNTVVSQNGETHSANDDDMVADEDSDMDTSDNDETTLVNGSCAQYCMNGSSPIPKCTDVVTAFDSDDGHDGDVNLETVMGKITN